MATQESVKTAPDPVMAGGCAWVGSEYVPIAEARIPILDAGFLWSDLTYDVTGVWQGKFFRLEDHLDRFEKACATLRMEWPLSRNEIREILVECVQRSGLRESYVAMVLTRGVSVPGERDPRKFRPAFYAYAIPYVWIVPEEQRTAGTDVVVARDVVRVAPGSINPTVKNFMWGDFVRSKLEAYDRGAWLAILTDGDGNFTEGPGFNVFVVKDGRIYTPGRGVLLGITRQTAIDIAQKEGIPVEVDFQRTGMLYEADEIFLTSTAGGVVPVRTLDGEPVGPVQPGPITTRIIDRYWAWHDDPRFTTAVEY
jgi:branched-subunit amino acid aminotransferase/4-amino-4-deoxychorismate lyase